MAYQLIAVDMDGTLLDSKKEISARNAAAVHAAAKQGVEVVIVTGRCYSQIAPYLEAFPEIRYAVCSSGAAILDRKENRILRSENLRASVASKLVRASLETNVFPILFVNGRSEYRPELLENMDAYDLAPYRDSFARDCLPVPKLQHAYLHMPCDVEKIDFYFSSPAEREKFLGLIGEADAKITPCDRAGLEINASGVDKGAGLKHLCRCIGVPLADTIAVGDAENDVCMLETAGFSVAMGNAIPEVRAAADAAAPDCDHDGVADIVERYLLAKA